MAKKEEAVKKNIKVTDWKKLQLIAIYALVALGIAFWTGFTLGAEAIKAQQATEASIKTQAVNEYKQTLKTNQ